MRFERKKELSAVLSVASVALAITGVVALKMEVGLSGRWIPYALPLAAAIAGFAAWMSIELSKRLKQLRARRQVFIVYAREDIATAREIATLLRVQDFNPWLDVEQITPGQVWQKAVLRALEQSSVALILISKNLSKEGFVQKELQLALNTLQESDTEMSPVVPVRLDNSPVPEQLAHVQWVNLFEEDGMKQLVTGLEKLTK